MQNLPTDLAGRADQQSLRFVRPWFVRLAGIQQDRISFQNLTGTKPEAVAYHTSIPVLENSDFRKTGGG